LQWLHCNNARHESAQTTVHERARAYACGAGVVKLVKKGAFDRKRGIT